LQQKEDYSPEEDFPGAEDFFCEEDFPCTYEDLAAKDEENMCKDYASILDDEENADEKTSFDNADQPVEE
ncbi:MAG: hypothetical protein RR396_05240, partial [Clostridiales bacterium]